MSKRTEALRTLLDTAQSEADNELRRCLMAGQNRWSAELAALGRAFIVITAPLVDRLALWVKGNEG